MGKRIQKKSKRVLGIKGQKMPEEIKRKISESHKGKQFSEEHRKKISIAVSAALTGKKLTKEHRENIRKGNIKRSADGYIPWNKGKRIHNFHSKETKNKISEIKTKYYQENKYQPRTIKYKNKCLRSSWEVAVCQKLDEQNRRYEYESTVVKYTYKGTQKRTIPDFKIWANENQYYIVEVKAPFMWKKERTRAKSKAVYKFFKGKEGFLGYRVLFSKKACYSINKICPKRDPKKNARDIKKYKWYGFKSPAVLQREQTRKRKKPTFRKNNRTRKLTSP